MRRPAGEAISDRYQRVLAKYESSPRTWLVTGAAGFIGSNLLEQLLALGQTVVGLDNFATGTRTNLAEAVQSVAGSENRFRFIEGDIRDPAACREACEGVDIVLHQAALGSVPRSLNDPVTTHEVNLTGFLNVALAARAAGVRRFVYASSSSVYGDEPTLPQVEERTGNPLSPYAVTKQCNESYASVCQRAYGLEMVGLRYFNVFGPRQDPAGEYAAVIPRWIGALLGGDSCIIYGDGETSRDFCYIANVVQANLLAATTESPSAGTVYNIACGEGTTLNALFRMIRLGLAGYRPAAAAAEPTYEEFRAGDIRMSRADITKARAGLGYEPTHRVSEGLSEALGWYVASRAVRAAPAPWAGAAAAGAPRSLSSTA